jgi:hypothetical protein
VKHILSILTLLAFFVFCNTSNAQTKIFEYTGKSQTYTVPPGVSSIKVELIGAGGGYSSWENERFVDKYKPGKGGKLTATYPVTPGETVYVFVGGRGDNATDTREGDGGFNGGGNGNNTGDYGPYCGGGGGGASDIRLGGSGLANRVLVAGGGGGAGSNYPDGGDHGGQGGGLRGTDGMADNSTDHVSCGRGATQTHGGKGGQWSSYLAGQNGKFGNGGHAPDSTAGGGGGGGYYGGGAGSWSGGGGGSSFSESKAIEVEHKQGTNSRNGRVTITPACKMPTVSVDAPATICFGEEITLNGKSNLGAKLSWDKGVKNGVKFVPPAGITTYTMKSSDPKECPYEVEIEVNKSGKLIATTTHGSICEGDSTTLLVHGAEGVVWDNGVVEGVPFVPPAGINTYKVTKDGVCGGEDEIVVVVNKIMIQGKTTEKTADHDGEIDVDIEGGTFPYKYKWTKDGRTVGTTKDLVGINGGEYQLEVVDDMGCTDKRTFTVIQLVPEEEVVGPKLEAEISQDEAYVTVSYPKAFEFKIENMNGETVITGHAVDSKEVDITRLPPGTYRVSLIYKQIKQYVTFVKS